MKTQTPYRIQPGLIRNRAVTNEGRPCIWLRKANLRPGAVGKAYIYVVVERNTNSRQKLQPGCLVLRLWAVHVDSGLLCRTAFVNTECSSQASAKGGAVKTTKMAETRCRRGKEGMGEVAGW